MNQYSASTEFVLTTSTTVTSSTTTASSGCKYLKKNEIKSLRLIFGTTITIVYNFNIVRLKRIQVLSD